MKRDVKHLILDKGFKECLQRLLEHEECMYSDCVSCRHARHVFRAVVPVADVSRVLADMFVACGRMAVYSQQPTKCWAPKSSWCISSMVASQTDCQQVESCSLQGTAPIFLALWDTL